MRSSPPHREARALWCLSLTRPAANENAAHGSAAAVESFLWDSSRIRFNGHGSRRASAAAIPQPTSHPAKSVIPRSGIAAGANQQSTSFATG